MMRSDALGFSFGLLPVFLYTFRSCVAKQLSDYLGGRVSNRDQAARLKPGQKTWVVRISVAGQTISVARSAIVTKTTRLKPGAGNVGGQEVGQEFGQVWPGLAILYKGEIMLRKENF